MRRGGYIIFYTLKFCEIFKNVLVTLTGNYGGGGSLVIPTRMQTLGCYAFSKNLNTTIK